MYFLDKRRVFTNMDQSTFSSTKEVTKAIIKGRKHFGTTTGSNNHKNQHERINPDGSICTRIDLSSYRVLTLYASINSNNASVKVCQALFETYYVLSKFLPNGPIDAVL